MARFTRIEVATVMERTGLVPLFYHSDLQTCKEVLTACYKGGARILEFTNRGDFAHEVFGQLNKFAEKELPDFGFNKEDIEIIKGMIMATKVPQKPHTLLEKIICDADLVYLGGDNYDSISTTLHKELTLNGIDLDEDQWLDMQINFLESHNYWTEYYLNRLAPNKKSVLDRLKSRKAS